MLLNGVFHRNLVIGPHTVSTALRQLDLPSVCPQTYD